MLYGKLYEGKMSVASDGTVSLSASLLVKDTVMGPLSGKSFEVNAPEVIGAVTPFVTGLLPTLEAVAGMPVVMTDDAVPVDDGRASLVADFDKLSDDAKAKAIAAVAELAKAQG
jgi:hypothetical protein